MGDVIRRNAAADDIMDDVRRTYTNATAKGGQWKVHAEARLKPVLVIYDALGGRLKTAEDAQAVLIAALNAGDERADLFLGRISDEIWNAVGRPAQDPSLSLIFPGGIAYYTDGPDDEQPERMELLAELLEANLHPKIDPQVAAKYAAEVRAEAARLQKVVEPARAGRARVELLGRVKTALARSAHMELAAVKRLYKAEGFTEAEIHSVIPDRGRSTPKPDQP